MMTDENSSEADRPATETAVQSTQRRRFVLLATLIAIVAAVTLGVTALLVTIFEHRQEARTPFVRLVDVNEVSTDPVPWGTNWPHQFDTYRRTVDTTETQHGGSNALPDSKLERDPWLRRLYAGYAFSLDYREARGHAYMLLDQEVTERVTQRPQSGACLHCHAAVVPTYRRLGLEMAGEKATVETLSNDFNWSAVNKGFQALGKLDYRTAHDELLKTPDGTPGETLPLFPGGEPLTENSANSTGAEANAQDAAANAHNIGDAHPVSCIDCHDPKTMQIRVTRPGFIHGIAALAASDDPVPHLPSIQRWRDGDRKRPYDPNTDSTRSEMRAFVCGQCHVEYYCATKEVLFFPWRNGLKVEQIEQTYDEHKFPDGTPFYDFEHGETGAPVYKAQHPEFELWSQGIHARSGVSCADCHMPYERHGAMKVSSHWVRSPLLNINRACQTCHNVSEAELREKVQAIQGRTESLISRAAVAMTDMLDSIREAQSAGATPDQLKPLFELQKKAMWRLDFISSENSLGFHADQEAARILAESIDFSRQAQALAIKLRVPEVQENKLPVKAVEGITPSAR